MATATGRTDVEDIFLNASAAAVASEVDDPDLVERPPQQVPDTAHRYAVEVRGRGNECHNARTVGEFDRLPDSPAPEVDVVVVDTLQVVPEICGLHGRGDCVQERRNAWRSVAHDTALAFTRIADITCLQVVRRVADHDGESLGLLEVGGALALGGDRILHRSELTLGGAVVECVGEQDLR